MSFSVDTNILVYASNAADPRHQRAREFVAACVGGDEVFYVTWLALFGYLRITTHPNVFSQPLTPQEAMDNVEAIVTAPRVRVLAEEEGFWSAYRSVATFPVRGRFVSDAHLAAILRQHGVKRLYTTDGHFRRFPFLDVRDPFESA